MRRRLDRQAPSLLGLTMWKGQRRARVIVALFTVMFAIVVALAFRRQAPASAPPEPATRLDPNAVVESTGGTATRFKGTREDVRIAYERLATYADGSSRMFGVTINAADHSGRRSFTVTGKEGQLGKDEKSYELDGDVKLVATDGLTATAAHVTYTEDDGLVRTAGRVEFSRGHLSGSGTGMVYDTHQDVLLVQDQALVHVSPDKSGHGGTDIASRTADLKRRDKQAHFEGAVEIRRGGQVIESDAVTAYLSENEQRVDRLELRGNSRMTGSNAGPGGLQALTGTDIDVQYAPNSDAIQHARVSGNALVELAGQSGPAGPRIGANLLDVAMGPDGALPVALAGRDQVRLTIPADKDAPQRTVTAASVDAAGPPDRGLTRALFAGDVDYRENRPEFGRRARSANLDVGLEPGMGAINEARFWGNVRFADPGTEATAANAHYVPQSGALTLDGAEPARPAPRAINERFTVEAARLDLNFDGPKVKATGSVKSVLLPAPPEKPGQTKTSAMLKQDQPVNVTGDSMNYDGTVSKATYTGKAQLWQADTSIRADTLVVDEKSGDLTGTGHVATSLVQLQESSDRRTKERVRSLATADSFSYAEAKRLATYTTSVHMSGPQGDMTASKIELYLGSSGDEIERAESYDDDNKMMLRETGRQTTGSRLTYFAAEQRYVVVGRPVTVVDECGRETTGRTLIFFRSTDTILVDGNRQIRTQTKGGGNCPAQ
jgi:LPS export ABC transporter protein LptC